MERFHYLSFMLEGEYHYNSDHEVNLNIDFVKKQTGNQSMNKSYMQSTFSQLGKALIIQSDSKATAL